MTKETFPNQVPKDKKKTQKSFMTTKRIASSSVSPGKLDAENSSTGNSHTAQHSKKFPTKKVIYLEIDDEITTIYDRLQKLRMKNIYIVVPKRAMIFQSIINLKILKRKAEDLEKNIFIITNDPNGLHLAKQVGLTVYDKLEGHEHPSLVSGKFFEDQQNITPLKASINALDEEMPTRQTEKKLSISEIVQRGKGKGLAMIAKSFASKPKVKDAPKKSAQVKDKLVLVAANRQALISLIVVSVIILLTITYIALPGATIKITPKQDILPNTVNVTLADAVYYQAELDIHPEREIPSYSVSTTIQRPLTKQTTGLDLSPDSTDARGFVTVINTSPTEQPLKVKTRFQTQTNLVFLSQTSITIPAARGSTPGTKDVAVVARKLDDLNQVTGERANIGPTKFFLPGLSPEAQKKIYAESKGYMTGGKATAIKMVSKEDIESAQTKLIDDLQNSAQVELQSKAAKGNPDCRNNLVLLKDKKAIFTSKPRISIPQNLEGQRRDSFDIQGEIDVSGIAYCRDDLLNVLSTELKSKVAPDKRLIHIDPESLTYRIDGDIDATSKKIVITASLKGIVQFSIDTEDPENGERLIKQIKDHVVGKDVKEAREYIQSLSQIDKVKIESWPAWAPTLPSVPDNISIEIGGE